MMPSPYDECYIMHGGDVVYVGCIANVESFAFTWRSEDDALKEDPAAEMKQDAHDEKAAWDARTLNGIEHSRCDYFIAGFRAGRDDIRPPTLALHDTGPSEFKQWYAENVFDITAEPIGSRSYHWMKKAWDARDAVFPRNSITADLLAALKAVVAIAGRKTVEFDAAKAAIARAEGAS